MVKERSLHSFGYKSAVPPHTFRPYPYDKIESFGLTAVYPKKIIAYTKEPEKFFQYDGFKLVILSEKGCIQ